MRSTVILIASLAGAAMVRGELSPVASSREDHQMNARSDQGELVLDGREMLLDVTYAAGGRARGGIAVLFDASSNLFIWQYWSVPKTTQSSGPGMIEQLAEQAAIYRTSDQLVVFATRVPPLRLLVWASRERAASLDDAEARSLREASQLLPEMEKGVFEKRYRVVPLQQLGVDFIAAPASAAEGPVKLDSVSRHEGNWEIVIEGQWKERLRLGRFFEFMDASPLK